MKTSEKIIEYIKARGQVSGSELSAYLEISDRGVRKQLASLLTKGLLQKIGKPPKVYYSIKQKEKKENNIIIDEKIKQIIDDNILTISPRGERRDGFTGFVHWCLRNHLDVKKTASEYVKTIARYDRYKKKGLISGMTKMKNTFDKVYLDKLFYLDFYSIERLGKTKLGQMLLYGKQSGDRKLIKNIIKETRTTINQAIKENKINAVGFIPWTMKREVQFMRELEKGLNLNIKIISIEKVKTEIIVPQKTLRKLKDREDNARNTFVVNDLGQYGNILLIDDAVGSGATLNEIAKQIKKKKIAKKVIGLALTGSFKGFDIISEV